MLALLLVACVAVDPAVHSLDGQAFGTTWSVRWLGEAASEEEVAGAVTGVLTEIDLRLSSWRADSELSAIRDGHGQVPVSTETAFVVAEALALAAATEGAFDPTVEPLMEVWGFRGPPRQAAPTDAELEAARARVGWRKVTTGWDERGQPWVDGGGTALDLSAIAKGHAVDRVSNALSGLGVASHLVEIGGEVRAHGEGPRGAWRVGVDEPAEGLAPGASVLAVVGLVNAAMATSGNYRSFRVVDGREVVHIMDPRSGGPARGEIASVSVIAPDCRTADGWATALMVLGATEGLAAVEARPDLDALWVLATEEGWRQVASSGMTRWRLDADPAR